MRRQILRRKHGDASESSVSRDAAERTGAAMEATQSLTVILEDQPKRTDRRKTRDGHFYTEEEFITHNGDDGHD